MSNKIDIQNWSIQSNSFPLRYRLREEPFSPGRHKEDGNEQNRARKMAIPRLSEESAYNSLSRFHRRHVRRACEACRARKTKCSGDKTGCENCRETGILCCYTDGKREKSKRQLADLSAKVRLYESVIRNVSLRFGVSGQQLINNAIKNDATRCLLGGESDPSVASIQEGQQTHVVNVEGSLSLPSSVESLCETDRVNEDFNRDAFTRATGFIGQSSEISWLHKLRKEIYGEASQDSDAQQAAETGQKSTPPTPDTDIQKNVQIASFNYYADLEDLSLPNDIDPRQIPPRDVANSLFETYMDSIHPSFPILGSKTFAAQFHTFYSVAKALPGNHWLAIMNLIFAIAALCSQPEGEGKNHLLYFSRARILGSNQALLDHIDIQQLQVEGLTSLYLLATGQMNRSWRVVGTAVRGAIALGLHLRNVGSKTSNTSKEIRYRVWWALYTLEHILSVITGRPSCITDSSCTAPIPVPFDEDEFKREDVSRLLGDISRKGLWVQEWATSSETPNSPRDCMATGEGSPRIPESSTGDWLKSLPSSMSLYFFYFATLISVGKRANLKLYSAETAQSLWPSLEFTIQSLLEECNSWMSNLPDAYNFNTAEGNQSNITQRTSLALLYNSTKIAITRPCLFRLQQHPENKGSYDFCLNMASECVKSACRIINFLSDISDVVRLNSASPWCILHYIMQATSVILLELSFRAEHAPESGVEVSEAAKKAVECLRVLSQSSSSANKAWKVSNDLLQRLAFKVGIGISNLSEWGTFKQPNVDLASLMTEGTYSLMDEQMLTPMPGFSQQDPFDLLHDRSKQEEPEQSCLRNFHNDPLACNGIYCNCQSYYYWCRN